MIRVVIVDDHPALRAGLHTVLDAEPGLVFAGESDGTEEALWPLLHRSRPDVVLMDYHLPHGDGLQLCYRIKRALQPPKVVVYSAYASPQLTLPARLAQADGLLSKGVGAIDLFEAIRAVNKGHRLIDPIAPAAWETALDALPAADHAAIAMLLEGGSEADVATTLGTSGEAVQHLVQRALSTLRLEIPAARA